MNPDVAVAKRLLIIDDSVELVALLKAKLTAAGFEVRSAFDGMYGIREALNFSPDLIVLDICFPAGGGLPVLERLKANLRTKSIPILVLTGLEDEDVERQAFELGASGYAIKPIKPDEVLQEVNRILTSKAPTPSTASHSEKDS